MYKVYLNNVLYMSNVNNINKLKEDFKIVKNINNCIYLCDKDNKIFKEVNNIIYLNNK